MREFEAEDLRAMSNTGRTFVASVSDAQLGKRGIGFGKRAAGTPQAYVTDFDDPSLVSEVYQDSADDDGDGEFEE